MFPIFFYTMRINLIKFSFYFFFCELTLVLGKSYSSNIYTNSLFIKIKSSFFRLLDDIRASID